MAIYFLAGNGQSSIPTRNLWVQGSNLNVYIRPAKLPSFGRYSLETFNRLRDFVSQADTIGLAVLVHECLECCA